MLTTEQKIDRAIQNRANEDRAEHEQGLKMQVKNDYKAVTQIRKILDQMCVSQDKSISHKDLLQKLGNPVQRIQTYLPILLAPIGNWRVKDLEKAIRDKPHDKLHWPLVEAE